MEVRNILLALMRSGLTQMPLKKEEKDMISSVVEDEWKKIIQLADMQRIPAIVFEAFMQNKDIKVPEFAMAYFKQRTMQISMRYYQMVSMAIYVVGLLKEQNIKYYLLKGVGLSTFYPKEEMRSFGDVDIYIPDDTDMKKAKSIFENLNCQAEHTFSDCHIVYILKRNGIGCEVELHWKLTADFSNGILDNKLENIYAEIPSLGSVTVCPLQAEVEILHPTMYALHLLMHMMQHFMSRGFGMKLFCDWTMFWKKNGDKVDTGKFLTWMKELGVEKFLEAVMGICVQYLGLSVESCHWIQPEQIDKELVEELLDDVMTGGEFGKYDENRMVITSRKPGVKTYCMELHRQMKRRFKKARKCVILWPVLWIATGVAFLYNNKKLRNVSTKKIMDSNKKRNRMIQKMKLFQ